MRRNRSPTTPTRRRVLGVVTVGLGAVAGCGAYSGSVSDAEILESSVDDIGETADGTLTVDVVVTNPSEQERSATLYVYLTLKDDSRLRRARDVSVPAGEEETITLTVDGVQRKQFEKVSVSLD